MEEERTDSPIAPEEQTEDVNFDTTLRPQTLKEYIGQPSIKKNLEIVLEAAKSRKEPIEHVLLYGPPGLGKTTLAHIIANEMGTGFKVTSGPAIEKSGDLAAILTGLQPGDILFIDEIHRLHRSIEEILYPAMEDYSLDIVIGKGPTAKTLRLDLPKFTIIGATTKASSLSAPLRDRFGHILHFKFYPEEDIDKIIQRSSIILKSPVPGEASIGIAKRARRTPRVANRLLKRVRDFAQVKNENVIDPTIVEKTMNLLEIDDLGLDHIDREILSTIITKFKGGPVGLNTLAAATGEEIKTIEDVYEPYLIQLGFINRTPRGRLATDSAYLHLGLESQKRLI